MVFDPKTYRNSKDGIGSPGDTAAVNSTDENTAVALLKGLYQLLGGTGITVAGVSTAAKQDTGNATLTAIDGHVDGIETLITSSNTKLDTLHADLATTIAAYIDGLEALIGTTNTGSASILAKLSADPATQTTLAAILAKLNASVAVTGTFWQATQPVSIATAPVLVAGAALIGRAVADASAATGGIASTARMASAAASTNATNVKTSAGRVYGVQGKNNAAYDVFLVLYDAATNPPVPGTTTIRKKIICPAGQAFVYDFPLGHSFATGIGYAFTKLVADADTTVLVAADITAFNLDYV